MSKDKSLDVEDQEIIRKSLGIILKMNPDIEVVDMAENGEVVPAKVKECQPELVLMDIHMPVMSGMEATMILKREMARQWQ